MKEPQAILKEISPHGNLEAIVEQDDRVAYLYLRAIVKEDYAIKTCWIRNLTHAPEELEVDKMRKGIPPMLPREFCIFPEGQDPLIKEALRTVWFPEGDGVALMENNEFLSVIPPWGGMKGFHG